MQESLVAQINAFVSRQDLTGAELKIKNHLIAVDQKINEARAAAETLSQQLNSKQTELLALRGQMDGLVSLVVELLANGGSDDGPA